MLQFSPLHPSKLRRNGISNAWYHLRHLFPTDMASSSSGKRASRRTQSNYSSSLRRDTTEEKDEKIVPNLFSPLHPSKLRRNGISNAWYHLRHLFPTDMASSLSGKRASRRTRSNYSSSLRRDTTEEKDEKIVPNLISYLFFSSKSTVSCNLGWRQILFELMKIETDSFMVIGDEG
ncbi:hypothetical protein F2Q68_00007791 [Brassica cretica]|uniref:Uncharacterized protein n=1 Tax=Brassica cretica TaxID=69181 RepID=A0A8S9KPE0_BRACR|nr:hypothetical protein F2Q68_00007791 [Brassica cretica]